MGHKYAKYGRAKPKATSDSGSRKRHKTTYAPGEPYGFTKYKAKKTKAPN